MKKILYKFAEILSHIFFFILIVISFIAINKTIINTDYEKKVNEQIAYNELYRKSALKVDGINEDGTKMTDEEVTNQLKMRENVIEIDGITPKIIEFTNKSNINTVLLITITITSFIILILLGYGIFQTICKISGSLIIGIFTHLIFIFNLTRYLKIEDFATLCKSQILSCFILVIVFFIGKSFISKANKIKDLNEKRLSEEKIKMRLKKRDEDKEEILNDIKKEASPIFIIAAKENSTITSVKEETYIEDEIIEIKLNKNNKPKRILKNNSDNIEKSKEETSKKKELQEVPKIISEMVASENLETKEVINEVSIEERIEEQVEKLNDDNLVVNNIDIDADKETLIKEVITETSTDDINSKLAIEFEPEVIIKEKFKLKDTDTDLNQETISEPINEIAEISEKKLFIAESNNNKENLNNLIQLDDVIYEKNKILPKKETVQEIENISIEENNLLSNKNNFDSDDDYIILNKIVAVEEGELKDNIFKEDIKTDKIEEVIPIEQTKESLINIEISADSKKDINGENKIEEYTEDGLKILKTEEKRYESIKAYLESKNQKEEKTKYFTEEYIEKNKDLPYANYDPEKDSPFIKKSHEKVYSEPIEEAKLAPNELKIKVGLKMDEEIIDDEA